MYSKAFKIKKKSGGTRNIYCPTRKAKFQMRLILSRLNDRVEKECDMDVVHGFVKGKNAVTNALCHVGYDYTLSIDLKNFFESIDFNMVPNLTEDQKHICFFFNFLAQGFPTSPALSNLACIEMDKEIKKYCLNNEILYTRYADDLTFSCNKISELKNLRDDFLPRILNKYSFSINSKKTRIQSSKFGRRRITGVMVDKNGVYPSRKVKRLMRLYKHKKMNMRFRGLSEWSKLKTPVYGKRVSPCDKTLVNKMKDVFQGTSRNTEDVIPF